MADTKIKICGLRREADIDYVNDLMPEYVGFVFYDKSRRYLTPSDALKLREKLKPGITPVGVFVDEKIGNIVSLYRSGAIEIAQLHGHENEHYIANLRCPGVTKIIKTVLSEDLKNSYESKYISEYEGSNPDYLLFDSGLGSGKTFDWDLIKYTSRSYFLAGGLDASNVRRAIEELNPYGVDVSSSLETDGYKDYNKMKAFVDAVRR